MTDSSPTEPIRKFLTEEEIDDLVREQDSDYNKTEPLSDNKQDGKPPRSPETDAAFAYLEKLLTDDNSPTDHRIAAARAILDHSHL